MADSDNPGQFGNRPDTEERAHEGGKASPGKFGSSQGADPHKAGQQGAEAQPREAKAKGGQNSHKND
ncbi:MAG TPA: hypothetical protein VLF43_01230 [Candidatus Saccharimonadales bacterium]|nr:hypothetical protein [Candidatus Saccharimonadales bacterium]